MKPLQFIVLLIFILKIQSKHHLIHRLKHNYRHNLQKSPTFTSSSLSSVSSSSSISSSTSYSSSSSVSYSSTSRTSASLSWKYYLLGPPQSVECRPVKRGDFEEGGLLKHEGSLKSKHIAMNRIRISSGYAAYYLDVTDSWFLEIFKQDVESSFKFFADQYEKVSTDINPYEKVQKKPRDTTQKYINYNQLKQGMLASGWKIQTDIKVLIQRYDLDDDYYLDFKEFAYLNILENIKYAPGTSGKNSLEKIKSEIFDFFDYLDCDKDGLVSSEDMYKAFQNLKTEFQVYSVMINDFVLKTMEIKSATLDLKDYTFGQLLGMFERVITNKGIDERDLIKIKVIRKDTALKGGFESSPGGECKK